MAWYSADSKIWLLKGHCKQRMRVAGDVALLISYGPDAYDSESILQW